MLARFAVAAAVKGHVAEYETSVALTSRNISKALGKLGEIRDALAARNSREGEVTLIKRLVARAPPSGSGQRRDRFVMPLCDEVDGAERPPMKCAPIRRSDARRLAKMLRGEIHVAERDTRARCVLMHDVEKDAEPQRLLGDRESLFEMLLLEVREIELPEQHRLRRPIDPRAAGEASSRPDSARSRCRRGHCA